ncbi:biliverdin-producing heme oxygenase [Aquibium carbonis]|uniref:Biliverdin-producing heme oxygenase n=1 Tax=Aquibium carbonis TaxID=2495581 RepID=A0A3R9ZSW6_9HYPH|nr:biliverdin-producing heme oxygenase [Aquibium carbonis]RST86942.1 biliverdin-producing heme oxygenase [Aquibium carbonis]
MDVEALVSKSGLIGRAGRLKAATQATHERLDRTILRRQPFASREAYGRLLDVQLRFHRELALFYRDPALRALIPGLESRQRFDLIARDRLDLGLGVPPAEDAAHGPVDVATGLGWLYVAEGSSLGAAFLLKEAATLGLSETFGARHLAAAPEGRGRHWKTFVAALDAADVAAEDEHRVVAGARDAFRSVHRHVVDLFG